MRKLLLLGSAVVLVLCGCNKEAIIVAEQPESTSSGPPPVPAPDLRSKSSLKLIRDGQEFGLDDTLERFLQVFSSPKTSFGFSDLPPGFQPPYAAKGWDTALEGVGAIVYDDKVEGEKVVAVMRQLRRSTLAEFGRLVETIGKENPTITPATITGDRVNYYFWDQGTQRLMLCGLQTQHDGWHITEALGDDTVLQALGISPNQAKLDQTKIDEILKSKKS